MGSPPQDPPPADGSAAASRASAENWLSSNARQDPSNNAAASSGFSKCEPMPYTSSFSKRKRDPSSILDHRPLPQQHRPPLSPPPPPPHPSVPSLRASFITSILNKDMTDTPPLHSPPLNPSSIQIAAHHHACDIPPASPAASAGVSSAQKDPINSSTTTATTATTATFFEPTTNTGPSGPSSSVVATIDATKEIDADLEPGDVGTYSSTKDNDKSEQAEGAIKPQKRQLGHACLLCRRKKIRCDSKSPSCDNCLRRGIKCIYPELKRRGRPPRVYTYADFVPPELQHQLTDIASDTRADGSSVGSPHLSPHTGTSPRFGSGVSTPAYAGGRGLGLAHVQLPSIGQALGTVRFAPHIERAMQLPTPMLVVDQAILDYFSYVAPLFPILHRPSIMQAIGNRTLFPPLWLAIHALASQFSHPSPMGPPPTSHLTKSDSGSNNDRSTAKSSIPEKRQPLFDNDSGEVYAQKAEILLYQMTTSECAPDVVDQRSPLPGSKSHPAMDLARGTTPPPPPSSSSSSSSSSSALSTTAAMTSATSGFAGTIGHAPSLSTPLMPSPLRREHHQDSIHHHTPHSASTHSNKDDSFGSGGVPGRSQLLSQQAVPSAATSGAHSRMSSSESQQGRGSDPESSPASEAFMHETELIQTYLLLAIFYFGNSQHRKATRSFTSAIRLMQCLGIDSMDDGPEWSGVSWWARRWRRRRQQCRSAACSPPGQISYNGQYIPIRSRHPNTIPPNEEGIICRDAGLLADIRRQWVFAETLRRLWWVGYSLDQAMHVITGTPRLLSANKFRVRLPESDIEWDRMPAVTPRTCDTSLESSFNLRLAMREGEPQDSQRPHHNHHSYYYHQMRQQQHHSTLSAAPLPAGIAGDKLSSSLSSLSPPPPPSLSSSSSSEHPSHRSMGYGGNGEPQQQQQQQQKYHHLAPLTTRSIGVPILPRLPSTASSPARQMVMSFREAVNDSSLSRRPQNDIPSSGSEDPSILRLSIALAALNDGIIELAEDIRGLGYAPATGIDIAECILGQLGELEVAPSQSHQPDFNWLRPHALRLPYSVLYPPTTNSQAQHYINPPRSAARAPLISSRLMPATWPHSWKSRMDAVQARVQKLEQRLTSWYMALPIARIGDVTRGAKKPFHTLPLVDRVSYFHYLLAYYGSVIRLHSVIIWTWSMLFGPPAPEAVAAPSASLPPTQEIDGGRCSSNSNNSCSLRRLASLVVSGLLSGDINKHGHTGEYQQPHKRPATNNARWANWYEVTEGRDGGNQDATANAHYHGATLLDYDGQPVECIRGRMDEMVVVAWQRCTEAAIAMAEAARLALSDPSPPAISSAVHHHHHHPPAPGAATPFARSPRAATPSTFRRGPSFSAPDTLPRGPALQSRSPMAVPQHKQSSLSPPLSSQQQSARKDKVAVTPAAISPPPPLQTRPAGLAMPLYGIHDAAFYMRFSPLSAESLGMAITVLELNGWSLVPQWEMIVSSDVSGRRCGGCDGATTGNCECQALNHTTSKVPCRATDARDLVGFLQTLWQSISPYWHF